MSDKFEDPKGICETCGMPIWTPHDHKSFGTFSPSEAAALWSPEVARERDATQPRQ